MGCTGNSIETTEQEKENMNQMKNLVNQQKDAAKQMGNLGGQMIKIQSIKEWLKLKLICKTLKMT